MRWRFVVALHPSNQPSLTATETRTAHHFVYISVYKTVYMTVYRIGVDPYPKTHKSSSASPCLTPRTLAICLTSGLSKVATSNFIQSPAIACLLSPAVLMGRVRQSGQGAASSGMTLASRG